MFLSSISTTFKKNQDIATKKLKIFFIYNILIKIRSVYSHSNGQYVNLSTYFLRPNPFFFVL